MALSTGATVKVEGLNELRRALRGAPAETRKLVRAANKEAAEEVVPEARRRVPRLTGRLAATIAATSDNLGGYVKAGTGSKVPYAGVIHFGWPRHSISPNPFLFSAVGMKRDAVIEVYEKALERLAREIDLA